VTTLRESGKPLNDREPLRSPRPFETADRDRFFGRTREIADLKSLIVAHPVASSTESGAGKSSLVNAGLIHGFYLRISMSFLPRAFAAR